MKRKRRSLTRKRHARIRLRRQFDDEDDDLCVEQVYGGPDEKASNDAR